LRATLSDSGSSTRRETNRTRGFKRA
jgi:hypothetical protein